MSNPLPIPVLLKDGTSIDVAIYEEISGTMFIIDEQEAARYGESRYQLAEGMNYEYYLPLGYRFEESELIRPSKIESNKGLILTSIYVGSLEINILFQDEIAGSLTLEIRSAKINYRTDYRKMMEDITAKCTDLIMQQSSPVYQNFTVNIDKDPQTLYQRFAFVDSIIRSEHFLDSLYRINSMPVKRWESVQKHKNISNLRSINQSVMRQIINNSNRTPLQKGHSLHNKFRSLPNKVQVTDKTETTDIPENRFIKYVIETFTQFCLSIYQHSEAGKRLKRDALASAELLERYISLPFLRDVSKLDMIPLNSPVLQRKEGYREVLQAYLMFDMAASLIWQGGDHVYKGGKRDVAVLYEYWLFFRLLDLLEEVFHIKPKSIDEIIVPKNGGMELTLKQGQLKMIDGVFIAKNRRLHIEFYYNRTFSGASNYPSGGSWTRNMRPDYTLSIRPEGISQTEAEERELIVYIHFDAKYKIDNYQSIFADADQDQEKKEQSKGNYKRADLLKMHAYKDAIRRTAGAYILYPGTEKRTFQSYHEILPGLGAFAVSPVNTDDTGLKEFLLHIVHHFLNRASQHELIAYHTYDTFKNTPGPALQDTIPFDERGELPAITYVLVAYYKDNAHLEWVLKNKLYNLRTDYRRGAIKLSPQTVRANYLLLHGKGTIHSNLIFRLDPEGPSIISKAYLEEKKYPSKDIHPNYLGYSLQTSHPIADEFEQVKWDITKLEGYQSGRNSALPFVVTLEQLMRVKE